MITKQEIQIVHQAVKNADVIGAGRITYAKEAIIESGFVWNEEHERCALEFDWEFTYDWGGVN